MLLFLLPIHFTGFVVTLLVLFTLLAVLVALRHEQRRNAKFAATQAADEKVTVAV